MNKILVRLVVEEDGGISHALYINGALVTREIKPPVNDALHRFLKEKVINSRFDFAYEVPAGEGGGDQEEGEMITRVNGNGNCDICGKFAYAIDIDPPDYFGEGRDVWGVWCKEHLPQWAKDYLKASVGHQAPDNKEDNKESQQLTR